MQAIKHELQVFNNVTLENKQTNKKRQRRFKNISTCFRELQAKQLN